ncbi:universal stress protein [Natronolimnohabitans innermongolicus]|uniref:UspA domain-containing protein n=1 Tax=Natronolimnohabitans innermongolicus JCM 12255 TaxID=1227499 RepID=L9WLX4_9EURY|nr:universal stress protein [Natronolimnohabitans innermongolicus]ELY50464.1 UspA domain-containing protein [Natronolimnohabitans innermongolicus JCM 12255]
MYRVLAPIDTNEDRADAIVQTIADLPGDSSDVAVVVLNVLEEFGGVDDGGQVTSADVYDEESLPAAVTTAATALESAVDTVETRREHGDPAELILGVADEIDADAIVLSGRRRSPAGKVLFGSVTQAVILGTNRPVTVAPME